MEDDLHWFGEWVYWDTQDDLDDAYRYLALWKKFLLKKLSDMEQEGHDQIVLRTVDVLGRASLGIKIAMKNKSSNLPID